VDAQNCRMPLGVPERKIEGGIPEGYWKTAITAGIEDLSRDRTNFVVIVVMSIGSLYLYIYNKISIFVGIILNR